MKTLYIYIYLRWIELEKRVARLPFHLSSNYYHRFAVDRESGTKDTREREKEWGSKLHLY